MFEYQRKDANSKQRNIVGVIYMLKFLQQLGTHTNCSRREHLILSHNPKHHAMLLTIVRAANSHCCNSNRLVVTTTHHITCSLRTEHTKLPCFGTTSLTAL